MDEENFNMFLCLYWHFLASVRGLYNSFYMSFFSKGRYGCSEF